MADRIDTDVAPGAIFDKFNRLFADAMPRTDVPACRFVCELVGSRTWVAEEWVTALVLGERWETLRHNC